MERIRIADPFRDFPDRKIRIPQKLPGLFHPVGGEVAAGADACIGMEEPAQVRRRNRLGFRQGAEINLPADAVFFPVIPRTDGTGRG